MSHHPARNQDCQPRAEFLINNLECEVARLRDRIVRLELDLHAAIEDARTRRDLNNHLLREVERSLAERDSARDHAVAFFHGALDASGGYPA